MLPTAISLRQNSGAVFFQLLDVGTGRGGLFVMPRPDEKLQQHRSQRDALGGETVIGAARVAFHRLSVQNARGFKLMQAVGKDVGGNALARMLKLTKRAVAANH